MNITEITRSDILDYLLTRTPVYHGRLELIPFLKRVFDLSAMSSKDYRFEDAEGDIWQHMINNYDWDNRFLLYDYLDLLHSHDEIFLKFLEECVHPIVIADQGLIIETVKVFNKFLSPDGYSLQPASKISGRVIYKAIETSNTRFTIDDGVYEVVLSYAGEDRTYVEAVAEHLKNNHVKIFYDKYEQVTLWGKDLTEHLDKIYRGSAQYCVIFISKHYADKVWTRHEWRSAFSKAVEGKTEYILPARFDDTEMPGLQPSIVYVDLTQKTPQQLGEMVLQKLRH
jgi:hypothetical protein